jgi:hypothetical protein
MQLYSCKVNLNSKNAYQVMRAATVPEIIVLRTLHNMTENEPGGNGAVVDIKVLPGQFQKGADGKPITDAAERERLERIYGRAFRGSKSQPNGLTGLFGHSSLPLPTTAEGVPVPEKAKPWGKRAQAPEVDQDADDVMKALA